MRAFSVSKKVYVLLYLFVVNYRTQRHLCALAENIRKLEFFSLLFPLPLWMGGISQISTALLLQCSNLS